MNVYWLLCRRKSQLSQCKRTQSTEACNKCPSRIGTAGGDTLQRNKPCTRVKWPWTGANGVRSPMSGSVEETCAQALNHQGGRRVCWEWPKFLKLCPILLNNNQRTFSKGVAKFFLRGAWYPCVAPAFGSLEVATLFWRASRSFIWPCLHVYMPSCTRSDFYLIMCFLWWLL